MRMRGVTWPGGGGHPKPRIWNQRPKFAYSLYNFYEARTTIKGSLRGSTHIVKRFSVDFLSPVKIGAKMAVFRELRGVNVKLLSSNPEKAHPCAEPLCLAYYAWKSVQALGCRSLEEPKKEAEETFWCAISRIRGKETPGGIATKFCVSVDIHDAITCVTFCDDRLWVWAWQGVEFPVFPLTCVVDLTTLSHYRASVWSYSLTENDQNEEIRWLPCTSFITTPVSECTCSWSVLQCTLHSLIRLWVTTLWRYINSIIIIIKGKN